MAAQLPNDRCQDCGQLKSAERDHHCPPKPVGVEARINGKPMLTRRAREEQEKRGRRR